jgi:hypothetical protein
MSQLPERFQKITDPDVIPRPSGAGALLLHPEEGRDAFLVLGAFRPADKTDVVAIVTFELCMQSVFGYPNDEAYGADPRNASGDRAGYGFFEVLDSTWPARLTAYNELAFPGRTPPHYATQRHYFIGCHDSSGEFLATSMKIELTTASYDDAVHEALERIMSPGQRRA